MKSPAIAFGYFVPALPPTSIYDVNMGYHNAVTAKYTPRTPKSELAKFVDTAEVDVLPVLREALAAEIEDPTVLDALEAQFEVVEFGSVPAHPPEPQWFLIRGRRFYTLDDWDPSQAITNMGIYFGTKIGFGTYSAARFDGLTEKYRPRGVLLPKSELAQFVDSTQVGVLQVSREALVAEIEDPSVLDRLEGLFKSMETVQERVRTTEPQWFVICECSSSM